MSQAAATPEGVVVVQRRIKATPETIFTFFTDPDRWLQWQGIDATLDPTPSGAFRMNVRGDGYASGQFTEIDPPRRLVFTWGWEMPDNPVPPGSSTVEIELVPDGQETTVTLTHRNLPAAACDVHRAGWEHYLSRLVVRAEGGDPGQDPLLVVPIR